jgi:hypothetical protein
MNNEQAMSSSRIHMTRENSRPDTFIPTCHNKLYSLCHFYASGHTTISSSEVRMTGERRMIALWIQNSVERGTMRPWFVSVYSAISAFAWEKSRKILDGEHGLWGEIWHQDLRNTKEERDENTSDQRLLRKETEQQPKKRTFLLFICLFYNATPSAYVIHGQRRKRLRPYFKELPQHLPYGPQDSQPRESSRIRGGVLNITRVFPKVSGLAAWNENCKWFSSLPLGAVVSLLCESV